MSTVKKLVPSSTSSINNKYNHKFILKSTDDLQQMFKEYLSQKSQNSSDIDNYTARVGFIRRVIHPTFLRSIRTLKDLDWNQIDKDALYLYLFECFVVDKVKMFKEERVFRVHSMIRTILTQLNPDETITLMLSNSHVYNDQTFLMRCVLKRRIKSEVIELLIKKHHVDIKYKGNISKGQRREENVIYLMVKIWLESKSGIHYAVSKAITLCKSIEDVYGLSTLIEMFNEPDYRGITPLDNVKNAIIHEEEMSEHKDGEYSDGDDDEKQEVVTYKTPHEVFKHEESKPLVEYLQDKHILDLTK